MRQRKICFYGLFGQGNLGNECTLQAIIYFTRKRFPTAGFMCICSGPENTRATHDIPAFPIVRHYSKGPIPKEGVDRPGSLTRLVRGVLKIPMELVQWVKALKTLHGTDMLIVPGTGFLTDAFCNFFGWPYDIFKWSLVAKLCHCKLFFVSVGAGPIYHPLSRLFIKSALFLADFRSYRDNSTMNYLNGIGFPSKKDRVYPDLAFNLLDAVTPRVGNYTKHRPVVGIGLMCDEGRLNSDNPRKAIYLPYYGEACYFC